MTEHVTGLTHFMNHYLGQFAQALLSWLHIKPENPEMPIPEHVVMGFLVLIVGTILALLLRSRLSVERPGGFQQVAELLLTDRKSTRLNSSHGYISYAVFCLKKKNTY